MVEDETTNAVTWFDMQTAAFGRPRITGVPPAPCLSAEAFIFDHYLVTYGGWTRRGLVGRLAVLDLCRWDGAENSSAKEQKALVDKPSNHGLLASLLYQLMA